MESNAFFYTLLSILLAICAFFIKGLVSKLEKGNQTLIQLDKTMAVIGEKIKSHDHRIQDLEDTISSQ